MVCVFPLFGGFHRHFSPWILFCFIIIWVFLPIIHYSLLCWFFMIHDRLFIIPLTWLCYSLFLIFQTQIFIIHFLLNPAIHYSPSTPEQITRRWNVHFWWLLGKHFQDRTSRPDSFTCCRVLCVVKIWKKNLLEIYLELTASNVALPAIPRCSS